MNPPRLTVRHSGLFLLTLALVLAGLSPVHSADPQQAACLLYTSDAADE